MKHALKTLTFWLVLAAPAYAAVPFTGPKSQVQSCNQLRDKALQATERYQLAKQQGMPMIAMSAQSTLRQSVQAMHRAGCTGIPG